MKTANIFLESFLDGFGMAGFGTRLKRPGAPTRLFAAEDQTQAIDPETILLLTTLRENLDSGDVKKASQIVDAVLRKLNIAASAPIGLDSQRQQSKG
jgi:hypothetical protein